MLILNKDTIEGLLAKKDLIGIIESAYCQLPDKNYLLPDRITINFENDSILYMPCIMNDYLSTKIMTAYPNNPKEGRPMLQGVILFNDRTTGELISMMDANYITAARTGAVGAAGAKHLTDPDSRSLGIIGAGKQGFFQALFISEIRDIDTIYFYDMYGVKQSYLDQLKKELEPKDIQISAAKDNVELVEKSDIIVTTTTSKEPVLPDDKELLKGKSYIAIGSYKPDFRELPDALMDALDILCIEDDIALTESGDILIPLESGILEKKKIHYISDIIENGFTYEKNMTTCFKSVGIGLLDLMTAKYLYKEAQIQNKGQSIEF